MQRTLFRIAAPLIVVAGLTLAIAPRAEAQAEVHTPIFDDAIAPAFIVGALTAATVAGFLIADTVSFARGIPFDEGLSITDLVLGSILVGGAATAFGFATTLNDVPGLYGVGAGALALGSYQISHAIWSLGHVHARAAPPAISLAPSATGVTVSIAGTF